MKKHLKSWWNWNLRNKYKNISKMEAWAFVQASFLNARMFLIYL